MPDRYAPMEGRAAPFDDTASWLFVCVTIAAIWYGFQIIFSGIYLAWANSPSVVSDTATVDAFFEGSTPTAVHWNLAAFAIYTAILAVLMRMLHGLGLFALIGAAWSAWREFWRVSVYLMPLYALLVVPSLFQPEAQQQFAVLDWLLLLPTLLPLLFVQISAEELVFRGYLQSHVAALAKHPAVWLGVPSVLFGLIHYDPTLPAYNAWSYVVWATALGLVCGDLTARSGTLGPAFAVHFINNAGAMFILAADDWLYGAALFVWPMFGEPWTPWIPFEALMLLTVWLAARLAIEA